MPSWNDLLTELQESARSNNGIPDYDGIRRRYLTDLQSHTGRDTILYATCFASREATQPITSIVDEDMTGFMTVVHGLRNKNLDLILHSPGGSLEAAESIVEYLRLKFRHIRVIVPQLALSAATILACGADVVALGKHSFLGPIDPQILVQTQLGARYVPAQAILEQFEKAVKECEDAKRLPAWIPMLSQYGPHLLVACENASALSKTLVTDWLTRWMFKKNADRDKRAEKIARWLADHKHFKSHGRHIPRSQLKKKGFNIEFLEKDQTFQDLVLSVHHATTHTFMGTGAGKIIENHLGKAFVKLMQQIQFPIQVPMPQPTFPQQPTPSAPRPPS